MTREEAIKVLENTPIAPTYGYSFNDISDALYMAIEALTNKSRPFGDCSKCIHTYGTLGCCTTVSNEWVYDCEHGMEQYKSTKAEPQGDLISRAEAAEIFEVMLKTVTDQKIKIGISRLWQQIKDLPSADRPRGEWISKEELMDAINDAKFVYDGDEDGHKEHDISELVRVTVKGIIDNLPTATKGET